MKKAADDRGGAEEVMLEFGVFFGVAHRLTTATRSHGSVFSLTTLRSLVMRFLARRSSALRLDVVVRHVTTTACMMKSSSLRSLLHPAATTLAALLLLLSTLAAISSVEGFSPAVNAQVASTSSRAHVLLSSPRAASIATTPLLQNNEGRNNLSLKQNDQHGQKRSTTSLFAVEPDSNNNESSTEMQKMYTPIDRPLLAVIDTISLIVFAAIGKSSHSANGDLDIFAVLMTAFPFVTAWLSTSPLTGVYSPDDTSDESNVIVSTGMKVIKGWAVAVPLGIALRGAIKGYVPPTPFIIVTLISTLVILVGVRVLFAIAEDVFVEMVN